MAVHKGRERGGGQGSAGIPSYRIARWSRALAETHHPAVPTAVVHRGGQWDKGQTCSE
jgi:hypothetical protein